MPAEMGMKRCGARILVGCQSIPSLQSPVAASPPVRTQTGDRNDLPEWRKHQRRPQRRQGLPQAVPEGREELSAASTAAPLTQEAEGAPIGGAPEKAIEAGDASLGNLAAVVGLSTAANGTEVRRPERRAGEGRRSDRQKAQAAQT